MLMDGKELARDIKSKIKAEIDDIKRIYNVNPTVASILVGEDPASQVYLNSQIKSYQDLGIGVQKYFFSKEISEAYLLNLIDKLNKDTEVDGIMINLPL
ncbi:bifunctional methylenetetrahydrofolate dehydrogenase/methenyltetrahydrofolate cyclohydrolase, partial [Fusobacterium nucleatum]